MEGYSGGLLSWNVCVGGGGVMLTQSGAAA